MKISTYRLIFMLTAIVGCSFSSYSQHKSPNAVQELANGLASTDKPTASSNNTAIDELMAEMTVREKVAQLFIFDIYPKPDSARAAFEESLVKEYGAGGIIVMDGSAYDLAERMNYLSSISKIPLLYTIDAEWGAAMRFKEYKRYPMQERLGKLPDAEKFVYKMGRNIGRELRDLGFQVNFAPVVDISPDNDYVRQNKAKTAIAPRSFGSSPQKVASLASAYIRGMKEEGIIGCGKHYPGIGDTYKDTHDEMPVIDHSLAFMDSVDLVPYQRLIQEGLPMIMVGHISNPNIDASGLPMSISKPCIEGLLRGHQNYKGIVITDAIVMKGVSEGRDAVEVTVQAYRSGSDILLMPVDIKGSIEAIADSVERGVFSLEELNEKVRRVLSLKAEAGLLAPEFKMSQSIAAGTFQSPEALRRYVEKRAAEALRRDRKLIRQMEKAEKRKERAAARKECRSNPQRMERSTMIGIGAGISF
ncbi:MAG: hypothetical protein II041_02635 [Bacteroidales bacterium]|nr:hypothetical protein [Bacteroidales bacterium]